MVFLFAIQLVCVQAELVVVEFDVLHEVSNNCGETNYVRLHESGGTVKILKKDGRKWVKLFNKPWNGTPLQLELEKGVQHRVSYNSESFSNVGPRILFDPADDELIEMKVKRAWAPCPEPEALVAPCATEPCHSAPSCEFQQRPRFFRCRGWR